MAAAGSMKQMKLALLVVSTPRMAAAAAQGTQTVLAKTSDGKCWLSEFGSQGWLLPSEQSMCCSMESLMPFADDVSGVWKMNSQATFTGSICQPQNPTSFDDCKSGPATDKTLTTQGWVDECRSQDNMGLCAFGQLYTYECETPVPDPIPFSPDPDLPYYPTAPTNPGTALVGVTPVPNPLTMCISGLSFDVCNSPCAPYGSCQDALVALSDVTPDESSNDPSSPDELFSCRFYRDTVLATNCPQCVDPTCTSQRLLSRGPSAGAWPRS